jgi:hypothetical protein
MNAIQGRTIVETTVLEIATDSIGGILNIPFIVANANATDLKATFWIEEVLQQIISVNSCSYNTLRL